MSLRPRGYHYILEKYLFNTIYLLMNGNKIPGEVCLLIYILLLR